MSRLIDADALKAKAFGRRGGLIHTADIDAMPTIEEQKKGEWIPEFDGKFTGGAYWFSCSKCKRIVPEVRNGGWNFCPQCGADMRDGNNE